MNFINKTAQIYQREGAFAVLNRGVKKIIRPVFEANSAIWFERDLLQPLPKIICNIPLKLNLKARQETIEWLKQSRESWLFNQREIEVGLHYQHYFPHVSYQGQIIGCLKVGTSYVYIHDYQRILPLPQQFAFIYDTYV